MPMFRGCAQITVYSRSWMENGSRRFQSTTPGRKEAKVTWRGGIIDRNRKAVKCPNPMTESRSENNSSEGN
jgi:hypothetical protein